MQPRSLKYEVQWPTVTLSGNLLRAGMQLGGGTTSTQLKRTYWVHGSEEMRASYFCKRAMDRYWYWYLVVLVSDMLVVGSIESGGRLERLSILSVNGYGGSGPRRFATDPCKAPEPSPLPNPPTGLTSQFPFPIQSPPNIPFRLVPRAKPLLIRPVYLHSQVWTWTTQPPPAANFATPER